MGDVQTYGQRMKNEKKKIWIWVTDSGFGNKVHEARDLTQNLPQSTRLQLVQNFDCEKISRDAFEN